jgi:hypothetical protein
LRSESVAEKSGCRVSSFWPKIFTNASGHPVCVLHKSSAEKSGCRVLSFWPKIWARSFLAFRRRSRKSFDIAKKVNDAETNWTEIRQFFSLPGGGAML